MSPWHASVTWTHIAVRSRHENGRVAARPSVAARPGEGPFTIRFADLRYRPLPTGQCLSETLPIARLACAGRVERYADGGRRHAALSRSESDIGIAAADSAEPAVGHDQLDLLVLDRVAPHLAAVGADAAMAVNAVESGGAEGLDRRNRVARSE
jgi:hypothetical protein